MFTYEQLTVVTTLFLFLVYLLSNSAVDFLSEKRQTLKKVDEIKKCDRKIAINKFVRVVSFIVMLFTAILALPLKNL